MALYPRQLSITYGSYTVSGIDGMFMLSQDSAFNSTLTFESVLQDTTAAGLKAQANTFEAAFNSRRQDISITMGGQVQSWSHSSNSGFDSEAHWNIVSNYQANSMFCRKYNVILAWFLPGPSSQNYRKNSTIAIEVNAAEIKSVEIQGTYSAGGGNSAYENYLANIENYVDAVLTTIGGTYEKEGEPRIEYNETDKDLGFTIRYNQLIFAQAGATGNNLDSAKIKEQRLSISMQTIAPGDSQVSFQGQVLRFKIVDVTYNCILDSTLETDLIGFYQNTIKPFILSRVNTVATTKRLVVLTMEQPEYFFDVNQISVRNQYTVLPNTNVFNYSYIESYSFDPGIQIQHVWDQNTLAGYQFPAIGSISCTLQEQGIFYNFEFAPGLGNLGPGNTADPTFAPPFAPLETSVGGRSIIWVRGPNNTSTQPIEMGTRSNGSVATLIQFSRNSTFRGYTSTSDAQDAQAAQAAQAAFPGGGQ